MRNKLAFSLFGTILGVVAFGVLYLACGQGLERRQAASGSGASICMTTSLGEGLQTLTAVVDSGDLVRTRGELSSSFHAKDDWHLSTPAVDARYGASEIEFEGSLMPGAGSAAAFLADRYKEGESVGGNIGVVAVGRIEVTCATDDPNLIEVHGREHTFGWDWTLFRDCPQQSPDRDPANPADVSSPSQD